MSGTNEQPLVDEQPSGVRYGRAVADEMPVVSGLLALGMVIVAILLPFSTTGTARVVLPTMAVLTALALAVLCAWSSRHPLDPARAQPVGLGVVVLLAANALVALAVRGEAFLTAYVLLVQVAAGICVLSRRWLVLAEVLVWAGWFACLPALPDGTLRRWALPLLIGGVLGGAVAAQRRAALDRLGAAADDAERAAVEDPLTGLLNRRGLFLVGEQVVQNARRAGNAVSCSFLDVDGLAGVNERQGHAAGDRVLVAVGDALRASVRAGDVVARWGGDEFCVVGPGAGTAPVDLEKRVQARVAAFPAGAVTGWVPRVSVGSAMLAPWDDGDLPSLLEQADREMNRRRGLRRASDQGEPAEPVPGDDTADRAAPGTPDERE